MRTCTRDTTPVNQTFAYHPITIYLSVSTDALYDTGSSIHLPLPRVRFGTGRLCTKRRCCMRLSEREKPLLLFLLQPASGQSNRLGGASNVSGCLVRICLPNNLYDLPQNPHDSASLFGSQINISSTQISMPSKCRLMERITAVVLFLYLGLLHLVLGGNFPFS
jgi:hypothetical protein